MTCCKACGEKKGMICTREENNNRRDVCRICHRHRACGNWRFPSEEERQKDATISVGILLTKAYSQLKESGRRSP